jgi:hypothetical protein
LNTLADAFLLRVLKKGSGGRDETRDRRTTPSLSLAPRWYTGQLLGPKNWIGLDDLL